MSLFSKRSNQRWRHLLRLMALPFLEAPEEALMGGQAVIEGVMMRSPHSYAIAVRQPGGGNRRLPRIIWRSRRKSTLG